MDGRAGGWTDERMQGETSDGWMEGKMDRDTDGLINGWSDKWVGGG